MLSISPRRLAALAPPLIAFVLLAAAPRSGTAAALWYNGDYDLNDAATNQNNVPINIGGSYALNRSLAYSDFVVGAGQTWSLTSIFSDNQMSYYALPTTAYWEIRTGMSAGNGGTVVASGDTAATATLLTAADGVNYVDPEYRISTNLSGITLTAGRYYLAIAPDSAGYYGDQSYVETTSGANAVGTPPGNNGNSFLYSNAPGAGRQNFVASSLDFSMGVNGTINPAVVPEPASALLLAIAATGLGAWSHRSRRAGRPRTA